MQADDARPPRDQPRFGERLQRFVGRMLLALPERLIVALARGAPPVVDGQRLDPGVHLILRALGRRGRRPGLTEPTIAFGRARYRREAFAFAGRRTEVGSIENMTVDGAAGPLDARLYRPPGPALGAPLLVYFHGGGFVIGDLNTHDEPCRILCREARTLVLSVAYRLSPEHPFPAALDDSLAAYRWAAANAATLGVDPHTVAVGGDSAGGNLAAVLSWQAVHDGDAPAAQLLIYPSVDPVTRRQSRQLFADGLFLTQRDVAAFERAYRGAVRGDPRNPRVSPLLAHDHRGLPATLVVTAGFDLLRDEGEAYASALQAAGCVVRLRRFASLPHGFIHLTDISPASRHAMRETAREWRALLDGAPLGADDAHFTIAQ
jgi:acetyl esterase